jgi:hypothetical protein
MKSNLQIAVAATAALAMATAIDARATKSRATEPTSFDIAGVARSIDAARQARQRGDVMTAERLCYAAFRNVEESALAAYDAFADRLQVEDRPEAVTVRAQSARLHELNAQHSHGTEPTSTYLGFSTSGGLQAYANLLRSLNEIDEAERISSLALAYQQVQQAHFQRTQLFQQGKDPRGAC